MKYWYSLIYDLFVDFNDGSTVAMLVSVFL